MIAGARRAGWALVVWAAACRTAPPPPPLPTPRPAQHHAASSLAEPATPAEAAARGALGRWVRAGAVDIEQPWALSHALLAEGASLRLADGALATDALVSRWADWQGDVLRFPKVAGPVRVEPHTDLMLKSLIGVGRGPDTPVTVDGRSGRLADLYRGAVAAAWVDGGAARGAWDDLPWTVQALAAWTPPGAEWVSDGHRTGIDAVVHGLTERLVRESAPLAEARASGAPLVKRGQGLFGYTCGGAHLLQAVAASIAAGHGRPGDAEALRAQVDLHRWRFDAELALTDAAIAAAPEYGLLLAVQRLKFVGHWLETTHRLAAMGMVDTSWRPDVDRAERELVATVEMLEVTGAPARMDQVRAQREQTWLDLLGDSSHAAYALDLGTGAAEVVW